MSHLFEFASFIKNKMQQPVRPTLTSVSVNSTDKSFALRDRPACSMTVISLLFCTQESTTTVIHSANTRVNKYYTEINGKSSNWSDLGEYHMVWYYDLACLVSYLHYSY